jgi:hypothetical protein
MLDANPTPFLTEQACSCCLPSLPGATEELFISSSASSPPDLSASISDCVFVSGNNRTGFGHPTCVFVPRLELLCHEGMTLCNCSRPSSLNATARWRSKSTSEGLKFGFLMGFAARWPTARRNWEPLGPTLLAGCGDGVGLGAEGGIHGRCRRGNS